MFLFKTALIFAILTINLVHAHGKVLVPKEDENNGGEEQEQDVDIPDESQTSETPDNEHTEQPEPPPENFTRILIRMSARKLPNDVDSWISPLPDPYVVVSRSNSKNEDNITDWVNILETRPLVDTSNPDWPEILSIQLLPTEKLRFDISDFDVVPPNDYLGQVVFGANELIALKGDFMTKTIKPKESGELIIYKIHKPLTKGFTGLVFNI